MAPTHVYSTGQTLEDIEGLLQLYTSMPHNENSTINLPPALIDPNYIPPNRGPSDFKLFIIPTIVATLFMAVRLSVRWNFRVGPRYAGNLFAEDWALLTGFVCNTLLSSYFG